MMDIFWKYLWLILPAGVANMIPPLAAVWWPKWDEPMDGGLKFRGKRLLGDHKTIRGLVTGTVGGVVTFGLQKYWLRQYCSGIELVDYASLPMYTGFLMAFGALMGDTVKSFFKRQSSVPSGESWFPWDQIDWVVGMLLGLTLVMKITAYQAGILIVIGVGLHMLTKVIGYWIKVNKTMI